MTTERQGQEIYYELNTSVFQDVIQQLLEWTTPKDARGATQRPGRYADHRKHLREPHP